MNDICVKHLPQLQTIMNKNIIEIVSPGIYTDQNAYWAMHYCSIFETLYEQKTMTHSFQRKYMLNIDPSLRNFVAQAGYSFFETIKGALRNFGLQWLLCHYLISTAGRPIFEHIVSQISDFHGRNYLAQMQQYGVFISCKDFISGISFAKEYAPQPLWHSSVNYLDISEKVSNADLCFLLKIEGEDVALWGEVEGNRGSALLLNSFWTRKKSDYYSFGIGVTQKVQKLLNINEKNTPPQITGRWVPTNVHGWKYVMIIESQHSVIKDFHDAIGTVQTLMMLGPDHLGNYASSVRPILSLIREHWDKHIIELISVLRSLLDVSPLASMETNPMQLKATPNIIV